MLQVRPHGSFRTGFDLVDPTGAPVGTFAGSVWKEGGKIRAGGQEWEFRRERGRRFALAGPAGELASADRTSFWSGAWQLSAGSQTYELVKPSWLSRSYELRSGGEPVGRLTAKGVFGNRAEVALPAELAAPVQVFAVAVVMTLWRRESTAAAGGAAAAASS